MTQEDMIAFAADYFKVERSQLGPETRLREDLGADSLDLVELAMQLETKLGITLAEDSLETIHTLGDVHAALAAAIAPAPPAAPAESEIQ